MPWKNAKNIWREVLFRFLSSRTLRDEVASHCIQVIVIARTLIWISITIHQYLLSLISDMWMILILCMAMWAILAKKKMCMEAIFITSGSKHLPVLESQVFSFPKILFQTGHVHVFKRMASSDSEASTSCISWDSTINSLPYNLCMLRAIELALTPDGSMSERCPRCPVFNSPAIPGQVVWARYQPSWVWELLLS